jgi:pilus assembly protein CpaB
LLLVLGVATLMGLLASLLVYRVATRFSQDPYARIVVARVDLPLGTEVKSEHVKLVDWPAGSLPPGALSALEQARDRVVRTSVFAGEPLLEAKLAPKDGIMSSLIPATFRGVTIKVDDAVKESGFILPGNRVDIVVSMAKDTGSQERFAKVILQNVQVLAAGQKVEMKDNKPVTVTTVTLALKPEQAERLALAHGEGRLTLALRNVSDGGLVSTSGVNVPGLWREAPGVPTSAVPARHPRAAAPPLRRDGPAPATIEVETVKGDKRQQLRFIRDHDHGWVESPRK